MHQLPHSLVIGEVKLAPTELPLRACGKLQDSEMVSHFFHSLVTACKERPVFERGLCRRRGKWGFAKRNGDHSCPTPMLTSLPYTIFRSKSWEVGDLADQTGDLDPSQPHPVKPLFDKEVWEQGFFSCSH